MKADDLLNKNPRIFANEILEDVWDIENRREHLREFRDPLLQEVLSLLDVFSRGNTNTGLVKGAYRPSYTDSVVVMVSCFDHNDPAILTTDTEFTTQSVKPENGGQRIMLWQNGTWSDCCDDEIKAAVYNAVVKLIVTVQNLITRYNLAAQQAREQLELKQKQGVATALLKLKTSHLNLNTEKKI